MDKELAERIFVEGKLIERIGVLKSTSFQKADELIVSFEGKLYLLTVRELP